MTQNEYTSFGILLDALKKIAGRQISGTWQAPIVARTAIKEAQDALMAPPVLFTLETDAPATSSDYLLAKKFIERFVKKEEDVSLEMISDYINNDGKTANLYQLTVAAKTATASMLDWLDEKGYNAYTSDENGITMFFEIQITDECQTAYIVSVKTDNKKTNK